MYDLDTFLIPSYKAVLSGFRSLRDSRVCHSLEANATFCCILLEGFFSMGIMYDLSGCDGIEGFWGDLVGTKRMLT
jgi:hypothetical protein